ncbi:MAG: hypothetical protein OXM56_03330 [Gammaproteobacteria bacterium]|nr:hypothetical protein [Gammaproteobacteria bacterium]
MRQPVVDTLQLSDALRRTGMDRDQAEGIARALGSELGRHVPARGDLEAFRSDVDAQFRSLDTKFNVLTVGAALTLAFLAVLTGLNLFPRASAEVTPTPSHATPSPVTVYFAPDGWSSPPIAAPHTSPPAAD